MDAQEDTDLWDVKAHTGGMSNRAAGGCQPRGCHAGICQAGVIKAGVINQGVNKEDELPIKPT